MKIVDLHVHSTKSDGTFTPGELVDYALQKELSAFALTDHDTIDGVAQAMEAAKGMPLEVIPGIELSADYEGQEVHIVGLYIDPESDYLKRRLTNFVNGRTLRNKEMCRRLTEHGMPVTYEDMLREFPDRIITRAHYAKFLLNHGYTKSVKEGFERFLGDRCSCFVPRKKISPMRAVEIILKAGGFPILAHPILYHMSDARLDRLVSALRDAGLQGIEAVYSSYAPCEERQIRRLAAKYDLCISGGSDFHGSTKPGLDLASGYGKLFIPEEILLNIKKRRAQLQAQPPIQAPRKILFTDLDGTLLDSSHKISDFTYQTLYKWVKAGHKLVLCSGRDINSVTDVKNYLGLNFPGIHLIGYNGGLIYDCDEQRVLYRISLTLPQTCHIMAEARHFGIHCHTYTDTHVVSPRQDDDLVFYQRVIKTPVMINPDVTSVMSVGPCKCIAISQKNPGLLECFRLSLLPWAKEQGISLMYSNPYYLELFPSASGKGASVLKLCEILGIDPVYSVAIGDAQNDLSMIEAAGIGLAMQNGSNEIKIAATNITEYDNDHDGAAHAILDLI